MSLLLLRRLRGVVLPAVAIAALAVPTAATAATTTVTASADTYATQATPTTAHGSETTLSVDQGVNDTDAVDRVGYLKFTVPALSGPITNVQLRLNVVGSSIDAPGVYKVDATTWTEAGLTWNNRPTSGSLLVDKGAVPNGWTNYDLTSAVKAAGTFAFSLKTASNDGTSFSSRETADRPQLLITYTTTTTTPPPPTTPPASGKPTAANTGVISTSGLTVKNGDWTITAPGTYSNLDVHGWVKVKASNVTIKNSILRGGKPTGGDTSIITQYDESLRNLVVEDVTFTPEYPSDRIDAMAGSNYTARRVEVSNTTDAFGVHGSNVHIESSWIHNLNYVSPSDTHSDGHTHNDGIEVFWGSGLRVTNSVISGGRNAAVQFAPVTAEKISDAQFVGNWMSEGGCSVNISEKNNGPIQGLVFRNNQFIKGSTTAATDCAIIGPKTTTSIATITGNTFSDGTAARVYNN